MAQDLASSVLENEIDFEVVKEDFTRYQVVDGTLLKIKICVLKILESSDRGLGGYPMFGFVTSNMLNATVPARLRSSPTEPAATKGGVEEIEFKLQEDVWQEYKTVDGFLVRIKPVVTKIFKHGKHNAFGEPIYGTDRIQAIQDVHRASQ